MTTEHLHPPFAPFKWPSMNMTRQAQAALFMAMRDMGYDTDDDRHELLAEAIGGETFTELTDDDAWAIIAHLRDCGWWK